MSLIGFSTGALALGDFRTAIRMMGSQAVTAVELSALRVSELPVLVDALSELDLRQFRYVALHAPSRFQSEEEDGIVSLLRCIPDSWTIVLHPDAIRDSTLWKSFGSQLALENMDRRKSDGRTAKELGVWFDRLPAARLCFDFAHAQQCDPSMTEAFRILDRFASRICQVHISELDSASRHFPLSSGAIRSFAEVSGMLPHDTPIIIESRVNSDQMEREIQRSLRALAQETPLQAASA